jgi:two-component system chemotaxis response regulator CheY
MICQSAIWSLSTRTMKKILVIENEKKSLVWFAERMVPFDHKVIQMKNYLDAWTWLSEGNVCDLIISQLDNSSDGIELLQNVRGCSLLKDIPVIMLSGATSTIGPAVA